MSDVIFDEKSKLPEHKELDKVLGSTASLWKDIKYFIKNEIGETKGEWKFYMKKTGWQLKTMLKKRNLFFFTPYKDYFRTTFIFGDKAVEIIEQSDLPETIIETLRDARKYMEGRGLSIEIHNHQDVENVKKLIKIKVNN